MRTRPGYSLAVLLTFALGIGANVVIFTVINAYILRPIPVEEPSRLVWLSDYKEGRTGLVSAPNFLDWRQQSRSLEDIVAVQQWSGTLTELERPMRVPRAEVTPGFFDLLGVQPMIGRAFLEEEGVEGNERVALLGYDLWSAAYGGDPDVVGKPLIFDGVRNTIVGVLPPGFAIPPFTASQIWFPLAFSEETLSVRGRHNLSVIGRLAGGVGLDEAQAELDVIAEGLSRAYPLSNEGWGIQVRELHETVLGANAGSLWMLLGGVGFVLLIACVNVAGLNVARGAGRQRELAVRAALGASRVRLLGQLLTENVLLAFAGGAIGMAVAYLSLDGIEALVPTSLARVGELSIDVTILGFAASVSAVTGIVSGLLPGLRFSMAAEGSGQMAECLRTRAGDSTIRSGLVVAEFAMAMILLVGAGLFVRSLANLYSVDLGLEPDGITTLSVTFPSADYDGPSDVIAGLDRVLEKFVAEPAVGGVAATSHLPLSGARLSSSVQLDGDTREMGTNSPGAAIKVVTPGYFETLGIPLVEGRFLYEDDGRGSEHVVVINRTAAERFWPGESPIGRSLAYTEDGEGVPVQRRVVGVIADIRWAGPQRDAMEELYQTHLQTTEVWRWFGRGMSLVVKEEREGALTLSRAQSLVSEVDPNLPVVSFRALREVLDGSISAPRFQSILLTLFAALALVLAAVGTYGVMAYSVRQRTREIGIRVAVGADRAEVMRSVLLDGARLALTGTFLGALGALALSRFISSQLWGVGGGDPSTYVVVAGLLGGVTVLACYVPARRAARVDPVVALRAD
jgi:putative ABC transport system permease protein